MSRSRRFALIGGLIILALVGVGWFWISGFGHTPPAPRPKPIVVHAARVARQTVPIYLEGLGIASGYYTVTINSRVDGQLQSVAFREGQMVHKGDVLAQIDPRPYRASYDQAVATEDKDQAQLANARRDLKRYQILAPGNFTSKQTLDTQKALVAQLTAQIAIDAAAIESARTQLDYTRITSPIDGKTGIRLVDPGNIVHAADTTGIVIVTQLQPISVVITLPEDELDAVARAQQVGLVKVTALARDDNSTLDQGELVLIDNEIDQTTGTVRLKARFPNRNERLWPGAYLDTKILVGEDENALIIPSAALQIGPSGPFTYVIKSDSTLEMRPLKIGQQTNSVVVVESGLSEGERVVTSNQYRLQPGSLVAVQGAPSSNVPQGNAP